MRPSDQTATVPPFPLPIALALIVAPAEIVVVDAFCSGPAPWKLPPTSAVPPPALPETSMLAPAARVTWSPSTLTVPPVSPAPLPEASSVPETVTAPVSPPSSTISPPTDFAEVASTIPELLITLSMMFFAARAVSSTVPPEAWIVPSLLTSALAPCGVWSTAPVTWNDNSLSPWKSTAKVFAPASTTEPSCAWIRPWFVTCAPASTAEPPWAVLIVPWLTMLAFGFEEPIPNW